MTVPLHELLVVCAVATGAGLAIGLVWQESLKKNVMDKRRAYVLIVLATFFVHGYVATALTYTEKVGIEGGPVRTAAGLLLALMCGCIGFFLAKKT